MQKHSLRRVAVAATIGNGLEWYDYALYGNLADIISRQFFPTDSKFISLIATFGVFAIGFIMRPVGAILFGYIGDRFGRKVSLGYSIMLMAIPTALIGFLPNYNSIGILAPILLTIIRLVQGLALGGEFSGSITYTVESAERRRNLFGSLAVVSLITGTLLGTGIATLFANVLSKQEMEVWGWRVPFIIGFFIGIIGLYIRRFLDESPHYTHAKDSNQLSTRPIYELFSKHSGKILLSIGLYMSVTVPFYMLTVFMNSFMSKYLGFPVREALIISTIGQIVLLIFVPVSALLCDKFGSAKVMIISTLSLIIFSLPIFWLINHQIFAYTLTGIIAFAFLLAFYIAPIPTVLVDIFPTRVRYTGMAIACNLCAATFGGTAPIVSTWLINFTHNNMSLAYYIILSSLISLASLIYKHSKSKG